MIPYVCMYTHMYTYVYVHMYARVWKQLFPRDTHRVGWKLRRSLEHDDESISARLRCLNNSQILGQFFFSRTVYVLEQRPKSGKKITD